RPPRALPPFPTRRSSDLLSAVGAGAEIGVLERSTWNNPEPELVLAVTSGGTPVAATLGNDVNLRDFEGRSALLLPEAKDNNASRSEEHTSELQSRENLVC